MPYVLRKALGRDKYWVMDENKKKYSKEPMSKEKAEAQRRALYAKKGGAEPVDEFGNTKGLPAVKGHKSVIKNNADFLKAIEEEAQELFKQQIETFKEATTLLENQKDKLESRKDAVELNMLQGSGIPNEKLAELLSLYSKKGKGKFSIEKLNRFLKKELKGGKLKPCPEGYSDNKAGLCVENCKDDEQDIGLLCKKKCPPGHTDTGIECIEEGCPPNYFSTLLTCYKGPGGGQCQGGECSGGEVIVKESWYEPITCEGDPWKPVWQPGHQVCRGGEVHLRGCPAGYVDDGLLCRKPISCNPIHCSDIIPADTKLKRRFGRDTRGKRMESNIDLRGTLAEIEDGLGVSFEALGEEFANKFDPKKNGVEAAFKKFGEDTKAAFEHVGQEIEKNFNKFLDDNPALRDGLNKFGNVMMDLWEDSGMAATIGNKDWWDKTMTDPKTYIMLASLIAAGAATVLSAGTMGPASIAAVMALNAMGPAANIIADAAAGRPVDALDFVALGLAMIPVPGAAGASGAAANAIIKNAALGLKAAQALPYVARAAQVGQFLVTATKVGQALNYVPKFTVINKPPPDVPIPGSATGCDLENLRWKNGYRTIRDDADGNQTGPLLFSGECKKPNCSKENWFKKDSEANPPIKEGCQVEDPSTDPEELYKRATWNWELGRKEYMRAMPDGADLADYRSKYHLDPKDFPEGFTGWTAQYPEPNCFYPNVITKESRRCLTEAEQIAELGEDEPAVRDPCYVLGTNPSDYNSDPNELEGGAEDDAGDDYNFDFAPTDDAGDDYNFNFDGENTCQPDSGIPNPDERMFGDYPDETFEETAGNQVAQENRIITQRIKQEYSQKQIQNQLNNKQEEFYLLDALRLRSNLNELMTSSITSNEWKENASSYTDILYLWIDSSMFIPELTKGRIPGELYEPPSNFLNRMQEVSNLFSGTRSFTDEERGEIGVGRQYYDFLLRMADSFEYYKTSNEIPEEIKQTYKRIQELSAQALPEFNERANQFIADHKMVENAMEVQNSSEVGFERDEDAELTKLIEEALAKENATRAEREAIQKAEIAAQDAKMQEQARRALLPPEERERLDLEDEFDRLIVQQPDWQRQQLANQRTEGLGGLRRAVEFMRGPDPALVAAVQAQQTAEEEEYKRLLALQPEWRRGEVERIRNQDGVKWATKFMTTGFGRPRRKSSQRRK